MKFGTPFGLELVAASPRLHLWPVFQGLYGTDLERPLDVYAHGLAFGVVDEVFKLSARQLVTTWEDVLVQLAFDVWDIFGSRAKEASRPVGYYYSTSPLLPEQVLDRPPGSAIHPGHLPWDILVCAHYYQMEATERQALLVQHTPAGAFDIFADAHFYSVSTGRRWHRHPVDSGRLKGDIEYTTYAFTALANLTLEGRDLGIKLPPHAPDPHGIAAAINAARGLRFSWR